LDVSADSFEVSVERADGPTDAELIAMFVQQHDELVDGLSSKPVDGPERLRARLLWAYLDDRLSDAPEWVFEKVGILVEALEPDPDGPFGLLSAGLVEDFVRQHGVAFLGRLTEAAERSEKWRAALRGAWGWSDATKIDARVTAALVPFIARTRAREVPNVPTCRAGTRHVPRCSSGSSSRTCVTGYMHLARSLWASERPLEGRNQDYLERHGHFVHVRVHGEDREHFSRRVAPDDGWPLHRAQRWDRDRGDVAAQRGDGRNRNVGNVVYRHPG
jgi:hypothetical protein